jgi:PST family polysaccharide transporter
VVGNTLWQLVDKVLRLVMGLLIGIWIARYLGPGRFGLLSYSIAFVGLFAAVADGGMQTVIVRELLQRKDHRSRILQSALILRVCATAAATFLATGLGILARPGDHDAHLMIFIISLSLLPQAWDVIDYDHQSRLESRTVVVTRTISFLVFSVCRIMLVLGSAGLVWFAWMVVGEAALSAAFMRALPHARLTLGRRPRANWTEIRHLLRTCWPLAIAGLSVMLYMRIDQVMLGEMLGDRAVGTFSAAVRVSESWYFIPIAVMASVGPALILKQQESELAYRRELQRVARLLCWLSIGVALLISISARRLISVLYGAGFADAAPVLLIHAWAGIFVSLGVAAGPWFVNADLLRHKMVQTLAGAAVNIAMNFYLIPRFGVIGAACSTLVSYAISAVLFNALSATTRPVFVIQARALFAR